MKLTPTKNGEFVFVTFTTPEEAQIAKSAMDGHETVAESSEANLMRSLFVDFAMEKGAKKSAPRPAPRPASRPAPVQSPASMHTLSPVNDRVLPILDLSILNDCNEYDGQNYPIFDPSSLNHCNDSRCYEHEPGYQESMKWLGQNSCLALLDIGRNPQPIVRYQKMSTLPLFSDGSQIVWYIPHPMNLLANRECLEGISSGRFTHVTSVEVPSEVLNMPSCWRC